MISVVINTWNAEKHLRPVLESVKGFDEIVVCDMYSTDSTLSIAEEYNCKIIYHENTGFVEPARNFAIDTALYEWILIVDADEIVPSALKEFLYTQIQQVDCPAAYRIPRKNYFMGKFMRCSYPDYILRFFKKGSINWPPYIHAHPIVQGDIAIIPAQRKELAFLHICNDSIEVNLNKTNRYTTNEIERRKNKKYSVLSLILESNFRFIKFYLLKGGILDGKAGYIYSYLLSFYKFITIAKILESRFQSHELENEIQKTLTN